MKKILATLFLASIAFANDPTDMDTLFRGNEYKPELSASLRDTSSAGPAVLAEKAGNSKEKSEGFFMLQFEAVADFDAAQRRKAELEASTGYTIQVVFNAPFYKLRAGGWNSRKIADDKAREISAYNIPAFVVKVR